MTASVGCRRRLSVGGCRPPRPGRGVRHPAVRLRRGPPAGPLPRGGRGVGGRRGLRHQGVPVPGHGPAGLRGGHVPRRLHRRRAARGPDRRRPGRPAGAPRQQQVRRGAGRGAGGRRGPDRRRLLRRDRPPGATAVRDRGRGPTAGRPAQGAGPDHPGRGGPHPRVRAHRPGRLQVRVRAGLGGGRRGRRPAAGARRPGVGRVRRHPRPPRQPGLRPGPVRPGRRGPGRVLRPARPARAGGRRWSRRGVCQR